MKIFFQYLQRYIAALNKPVFLLTSLLVAGLIITNYTIGIEPRLSSVTSFPLRVSGFFLLYSFIFCASYWLHFSITNYYFPRSRPFLWLLIVAPALFAFKISYSQIALPLAATLPVPFNRLWEILLDWPVKAIIILVFIIIVWKSLRFKNPIAGMTAKNFSPKPYLLLLLLMVPLIIFASTQADFLVAYPKLKNIAFMQWYSSATWKYDILYELSYGSDFFNIELFFRGFVVLAFMRFAGKDAILPMAAFYCSIHFGKPLFECISSYFGGLILGVIVYRTQSIWGGLITHLGIAWLMEVAGYWGAQFSHS